MLTTPNRLDNSDNEAWKLLYSACWLPPAFIISNKTGKSKYKCDKIRTTKKATANSKKPRMPYHSKAPLLKEHRVSTVTYSITQWPGPINTFFIHHFFHSQIVATVPWSKASTTCSLKNKCPIWHHLGLFNIITFVHSVRSQHVMQ